MSITNNAYFNYVGTSVTYAGAAGAGPGDTNPTYGNPQLSGCYAVGSGSLVFSAPVSFPTIVGGWGPPGFVLPSTGTAPSYPSPTC